MAETTQIKGKISLNQARSSNRASTVRKGEEKYLNRSKIRLDVFSAKVMNGLKIICKSLKVVEGIGKVVNQLGHLLGIILGVLGILEMSWHNLEHKANYHKMHANPVMEVNTHHGMLKRSPSLVLRRDATKNEGKRLATRSSH